MSEDLIPRLFFYGKVDEKKTYTVHSVQQYLTCRDAFAAFKAVAVLGEAALARLTDRAQVDPPRAGSGLRGQLHRYGRQLDLGAGQQQPQQQDSKE